MGDSSEASLVLELADVVTALTCRQNEFLGHVRGFRADVLGPPAAATYEPPPPRLLQPPPPPPPLQRVGAAEPGRLIRPPMTVVAPPLPAAPTASGTAGAGDHRELGTSPPHTRPLKTGGDQRRDVLPTKRDYDYFAELDDLLARIPTEATPRELDPPA
jgi:hypothetical protein